MTVAPRWHIQRDVRFGRAISINASLSDPAKAGEQKR
jgi:hypothetical protein